jgi:hypothetical protein
MVSDFSGPDHGDDSLVARLGPRLLVLVVTGILKLTRKQWIHGVALIVVGFLVGPGGVLRTRALAGQLAVDQPRMVK